jgi:3-methyladenine DNA glycosylase/8-oxoguanine DNA glycosylase
MGGWNFIAAISFVVSLLVAIKDISQLVVFVVKKYGMKLEVNLRPESYITLHQLDEASMESMQKYLTDADSRLLGADGNTALHALAKQSEDVKALEEAAALNPHQLFMLNKHG